MHDFESCAFNQALPPLRRKQVHKIPYNTSGVKTQNAIALRKRGKQKRRGFGRVFLMVVGQGFEPWKAMPTDLQSVLFDRSRIPPEILAFPRILPLGRLMVLGAGLEPARISPHAPQACVSANFTTRAGVENSR